MSRVGIPRLAALAVLLLPPSACQLITGTGDLEVRGGEGGGGLGGAGGATTTTGPGSGGCGGLEDNPEHCGACGHSCLGGECIQSKCQPRPMISDENIESIAVSGDTLYWSMSAGEIHHCTLPDCTRLGIEVDTGTAISDLAVDEMTQTLYWVGTMGGEPEEFIGTCAIGDCDPMSRLVDDAPDTSGLAATAKFVYYTTSGILKQCDLSEKPCSTQAWAEDAITSVAADSEAVFFIASNGEIQQCPAPNIAVCPAPTAVTTPAAFPAALAVDGTNLYFGDTSGTLHFCDKASCRPAELQGGLGEIESLAADGVSVLWYDGLTIWRLAL